MYTTPILIGNRTHFGDLTNKWLCECVKCAHKFSPPGTRIIYQVVDCPKCGCTLAMDYTEGSEKTMLFTGKGFKS